MAGDPFPAQGDAVVFEKRLGADETGFHSIRIR
jgi:hypothetical protein